MRTTKGELFIRQTAKHGRVWCLRYQHEGQRCKVTLKDSEGGYIASKTTATKAADKLLEVVTIKDEVAKKRLAVAEFEDAMDTAKRIDDDRRRQEFALSTAWDKWPYNQTSNARRSRKLSPRAIADNRRHWKAFRDWAENHGVKSLLDVDPTHARAFRDHLVSAGRTPASVNRLTTTVRVVFALAKIVPNPFATSAGLKPLDEDNQHHEAIDPVLVAKAIESAEGELRTLIVVGATTGLRLADACRLDWADIDLNERTIRRTTRKTRKAVTLRLSDLLLDGLRQIPPSRRRGPVMPSMAAKHEKDPSGISKSVRKAFEDAGVETRSDGTGGRLRAASLRGFHALRTTFITEAARQGIPLSDVQRWVGHSSPNTTRIYDRVAENPSADKLARLFDEPGERSTHREKILAAVEAQLDGMADAALASLAEKISSKKVTFELDAPRKAC